eukprot:1161508-Pelagomonas_calceolata.AAC.7
MRSSTSPDATAGFKGGCSEAPCEIKSKPQALIQKALRQKRCGGNVQKASAHNPGHDAEGM